MQLTLYSEVVDVDSEMDKNTDSFCAEFRISEYYM